MFVLSNGGYVHMVAWRNKKYSRYELCGHRRRDKTKNKGKCK